MAANGAKRVKTINLALQGGGAHGAFTWGVLDAMLEDGRIGFEAVTGTSAGAMNAIALADGLADGGAEGARAQLERFWRAASRDGRLPDATRRALDTFMTAWNPAGAWWMDVISKTATPYDFNPLNINPLKDILEREINFRRIREESPLRLAIAATNVETGKIRIFETKELTSDHVLASAALPLVFQAVRIGDEHFWDGGYMGNPALFPLFYGPKSNDVLLVQINPVVRKGVPRTPGEIHDRLNEITFNATLLREFRAVDFVTRLIDQGKLSASEYKRVLMHRISMDDYAPDGGAGTKMSTDWTFFTMLRDAGRKAAQAFLAAHFVDLGVRSSFDVRKEIE